MVNCSPRHVHKVHWTSPHLTASCGLSSAVLILLGCQIGLYSDESWGRGWNSECFNIKFVFEFEFPIIISLNCTNILEFNHGQLTKDTIVGFIRTYHFMLKVLRLSTLTYIRWMQASVYQAGRYMNYFIALFAHLYICKLKCVGELIWSIIKMISKVFERVFYELTW